MIILRCANVHVQDEQLINSYRLETQSKLKQVEALSDADHPRVFHNAQCATCGVIWIYRLYTLCVITAIIRGALVIMKLNAPIVRVRMGCCVRLGGIMRSSPDSMSCLFLRLGKEDSML